MKTTYHNDGGRSVRLEAYETPNSDGHQKQLAIPRAVACLFGDLKTMLTNWASFDPTVEKAVREWLASRGTPFA